MRTGLKILYVICFLLLLGSGDFRVWGLTVTGKDVSTEALGGEDVTIPCLISGVPIPLNLQILSVVWTQILLNGTKHEVYSFRDSRHQPQRNGSHMNDRDLQQGNASLSIPNIQTTDEGDYVCFVIVTPDAGIGTSTLHVSVKPQATLSDIKLIESAYVVIHVYCKVSKFYPEAVDIQWVKYSKRNGTNSSLDEDAFLTIPLRNSDGTYNVTSLLTVKQSNGTEPGDVLFCIVRHRSLMEDMILSFIMPSRNPILDLYGASIALNVLQIDAGILMFIFKNGRRRLIAIIITNVLYILVVILYCFVMHFSTDIHGMEMKSFYIVLSTGIVLYLLLFCGIILWLYYRKGNLTVSEISGDQLIFHEMITTLSCQITDFRQKDIHIHFYMKRRNDIKRLMAFWKSTDQISSNNSPNDTSEGQRDNDPDVVSPLEEDAECSTLLPVKMDVKITKSRTGMYTCLCSITVTPSADKDNGAVLEVKVEHASLKSPVSVYSTLTVYKDIPIVSDIIGDQWISHMKKTTLSFQITEFKLKEIHINVYQKRCNNIENRLIHSWESVGPPLDEDNAAAGPQNEDPMEEKPESAVNNTLPVEMEVEMEVEMTETEDGTYKCDCRISLTPSADIDDGAVLTVEVTHASLKWPQYRYQTLNVIKGDKPSLWRRWRIWSMKVYDRFKIFWASI